MRPGWRLFRRDLAAGELTLLLAALILAVAATTTLRFLASSLEEAIRQQAAQLVGADLVLGSTRALDPVWSKEAAARGLQQTRVLEFVSMAQQGDAFQLSSVKAVEAGYPLRGVVKVRRVEGVASGGTPLPGPLPQGERGIPEPGTVWVESRLLELLHTTPGQALVLGEATFTIAGVLDQDADRGGGFSIMSPRILMNLADVPATGVLQPGSRYAWRLLLAGKPEAIQAYRAWGEPRVQAWERLRDVQSANRQVSSPITNANAYLSLAAMAAVLLSGVAVSLASRRYSERRRDSVAILRCLGATRRELGRVFGLQLGLVWIAAMLAGGLTGWLAAHGLFGILQSLLPVTRLEFVFTPALLTGVATATLCLLGFALPGLLELYRVAPLRALRRDLDPPRLSTLALTGCALAALFVLMAAETGKLKLTAMVLGGGLAGALLLGGLLYRGLTRWRQHLSARGALAQAVASLCRQPAQTVGQVLALALGLTAMLMVGGLRGELLDRWRAELPARAPNQFAVTIPAEQLSPLQQALQRNGWTASDFYPVVRGRLVQINGKPVEKPKDNDKAQDDNRDNALDRELNLTWRDTLPPENKITEGRWLKPDQAEVSVEADLAKRLHLKLNDTLTLQMAEGAVTARITSLRKVDWDSFQPNFYLIFPRAQLQSYPASYLTSFYVPPAEKSRMSALVRGFPTIIFFDVGLLMDQLQSLMAQLTLAVQSVLGFVVLAGVLVLLAGIAASLDTRRREAALLRALGALSGELRRRAGLELALLGALAGLVAVVLDEALMAGLTVMLLEKSPGVHPWLWVAVPFASAAVVAGIGLVNLRGVWRVAPVEVLREG